MFRIGWAAGDRRLEPGQLARHTTPQLGVGLGAENRYTCYHNVVFSLSTKDVAMILEFERDSFSRIEIIAPARPTGVERRLYRWSQLGVDWRTVLPAGATMHPLNEHFLDRNDLENLDKVGFRTQTDYIISRSPLDQIGSESASSSSLD